MKCELTIGSSLCDSKSLSQPECKAPEFSCKIDTQILNTFACCRVPPFKRYCAHLSRPFVTQGKAPQLSLPSIWPTARNIRSCADLTFVLSRPIQFHGARSVPVTKVLTSRLYGSTRRQKLHFRLTLRLCDIQSGIRKLVPCTK
jgi:hypothetical protein